MYSTESRQLNRAARCSPRGTYFFSPCIARANPPYSIKQWDRGAFENDKYGRNFLGTPPQGRADYAFFQHILKSLKPDTGRCAILFPHGVLFRDEEADMRRKLIESDLVDCVIGLGPNLFFNSPMEACIVICRTNKPLAHRGKVMFINAVHDVIRKNSQSYLTDEHIEKIAGAYREYSEIDGFAHATSIDDIAQHNYSLNIVLYANPTTEENDKDDRSFSECYSGWDESRFDLSMKYDDLLSMIGGEQNA